MDPRKCISYLTIEHRGPLSPEQQAMTGRWLFGCDICQDVCPFNRKAPPADMTDLAPHLPRHIPLAEIAAMDETEYRARFKGTPVRRVKRPVLQAIAAAK
jgi:epoxyqueuosine reductase